jgi:hypothetical protein
MDPCIISIFQYTRWFKYDRDWFVCKSVKISPGHIWTTCISYKKQRYTVYYIWKLLYIFRVVFTTIIRSAYNCIYSIWYLSHCYCYLQLSWKSWNRFENAVSGVRHPQHTQTCFNSSTIAADSNNGVTNTRCCRYSCMSSWWWVEVPPETCRAVSRYIKNCVTLHLVGYILEYTFRSSLYSTH